MRVVVTGQVGLDKQPFLQRAVAIGREAGEEVALFNIGDMMYAEAPDVAPGKILDLSLSRLNTLRRSVMKDILAGAPARRHVIVNTHATFRWRHGLFHAFDYDHMKAFHADLYVVLVDNVDRVHYRLRRDGHADHTLKDLMVWREEEILATEMLSQIGGGHGTFYILSRGIDDAAVEMLVRLMFRPAMKKAYASFPMTHVADQPDLLAEIVAFRRQMRQHFICFDPGEVDEKDLALQALRMKEAGHQTIEAGPPGERVGLQIDQVLDIIPDVDGQIYARDFKLIDQSDMIVSYIPELADGRPGLSSGVERELQHAHEATRDVFVIWRPKTPPSPFVTETATKVFSSVEEAVEHFCRNDYIPQPPAGSLFAQKAGE